MEEEVSEDAICPGLDGMLHTICDSCRRQKTYYTVNGLSFMEEYDILPEPTNAILYHGCPYYLDGRLDTITKP